MRESNVKNVQAELTALIAENNFPTEDVSYDDCWADEPGKASPFYQEEYASYFGSTQINVIANIAYMQTLLASNDARLTYAFAKSDKGDYQGGVSGTNMNSNTPYKADYWSRPVFTYNMPVFMITVSEIEFFKAEYYARYGSPADAETHYNAAIDASFATAGVTGADAIYTTYYPYDQANYKKVIGIQKWIALGMTNNFEAWCELRRLGYPAFGTAKGSDITDKVNWLGSYPMGYEAGTLYEPIDVNTDLKGKSIVLQRFMYPESSTARNGNAPDNKLGSVAVFWAVK